MSLSQPAIESAQSTETGVVWLILLKIDHDSLDEPFFLVNNTETISFKYTDYLAYPFNIVLAPDDGESFPKVKLEIDNVDRALVETIRLISEPPVIEINLVLCSDASINIDEAELTITNLTLREVSYNSMSITGDLYADDILNSRYPADSITLAGGYNGMFT